MRNAVRKLRATKDKEAAIAMYPAVQKFIGQVGKDQRNSQEQGCKLEVKIGAPVYISKVSLSSN